jgi:hypothetical protein
MRGDDVNANSVAYTNSVIAGLDPAIHLLETSILRRLMDARVKPAHDGQG